ncbi:MAG: cache domain-containing protein, partial [Vallitaleaceae bacterium]|nr:cache domain-containing protein [Vallitaleaceae bacterium]
NPSIKSKFIFFIILLLIVGNIGLGIPSYFVAKSELEDKGRIILKNSVDIALQLIDQYAISVKNGILSEEEAKEQVREFLVGSRNPDGTRKLSTPIDLGKNGYFLAYDDAGYEVMHPTLEGQNVIDVVSYGKDAIPIVKEQLRIGRNGGFLEYEWYYPNRSNTGRKISYSQYEPNWEWTLVATAYASDYNQAANKIMQTMLVLFVLTVLLAFLFTTVYLKKMLEPIILVIGSMKKKRYHAIEKIKEYQRKDEFTQLAQGYNEMLESLEFHLHEINKREKELKRLAYIDDLTKLANLNMISGYANRKMEANPQQGSLLLIDLREFKMINSVYGMAYGDDMIRWIAKSLIRIKPSKGSLLARIGGNEFAFWLKGADEACVLQWIKDIERYWQLEYDEKRLDIKIRFTMAYVINDEINEDFERILQKANIAIQYAKANDLTYTKYNEEINASLEYEAEIKRNAEKGLMQNEFYPVYQEKIDIKTHEVLGVEALARWESKSMGIISPGVFIP